MRSALAAIDSNPDASEEIGKLLKTRSAVALSLANSKTRDWANQHLVAIG